MMRPIDAAGLGVLQHPLAELQREIANRHEVVVCFRGEADHVVELQVLEAARENQVGAVEDLVVGDRLVDDAAQPVRTGFGRDRDRALAAGAEDPDDRLGDVVEAERRRADAVAHFVKPGEDALDLRVIAERDRHEADTVGVNARPLGELQDPLGRERADRQVVVAGPAEAAQVRAASDDLDEEARSEFGVGREDPRGRRIDRLRGLERGLANGHLGVDARRRPIARHRAVGGVLRFVERRDVEAAFAGQQGEQVAAAGRFRERAGQGGHEHFALTGGDDVGKRRERLRVDERHGAADDDERVPF